MRVCYAPWPMTILALLVVLLSLVAHAEDGVLKVKSSVPSAVVYLDNQLVGPVPLTTYAAVGDHTLRVVADNHDPFVRKVSLQAGKTTELNASLNPGGGTVEWFGPPGARLKVDGEDRGMLPIRLPDLAPGTHQWRVEAPRLEPAVGAVEFAAGKNVLILVEMSSSKGIFVVETKPPGAKVYLDGAEVGESPVRLAGIEQGVHGVRIVHPDRAEVIRSIDTTDGSRGEVIVTLPPTGAGLKVATGNPAAEVWFNDALVGTGEVVEIGPIEKGRGTLRVAMEGAEVSGPITLPAKGKLSVRVSGDRIVEQKPLVQRWGFWAVIGGGVAAGGVTVAAVAASTEPAPLPAGDTVVVLP